MYGILYKLYVDTLPTCILYVNCFIFQSEIARQFDLPERQSKLNTMLREEGLKDEQVYCVCRTADVSRFMM